MASVNYTVRLDEADKQSAEKVFNQLGLTLAAGLNIYIKAVARLQKIPFELTLNEQGNSINTEILNSKTKKDKKASFNALCGILAGYEIDIEKEREERIISS